MRASAWRSICAKIRDCADLRVAPLTTFDAEPSTDLRFPCYTDTTSDGALCGWMSIREPKRCPATMYGVRPTIVPSTGA
jgi:hypothetical protein